MRFFDPLVLRWTGKGKWFLEKELRCESKDNDAIYIPAGFSTDLASIPRVLWAILPPAGPWGRAAVVHDWCYAERLFSRTKCDDLFLEAMLDDGVDRALAKMMYAAVRIEGQEEYDDDD